MILQIFYPVKINSQEVISGETETDYKGVQVFEDIASIFYYGNGDTIIHTWNNSFQYSGSNGWFSTKKGGYEGTKLLHSVSRDWNADGYTDSAGFYDYENDDIREHVWLSNGSSKFNYEGFRGWWAVKGYPAKNIVNPLTGEFGD